tara:strand:- start:447 stop:977 length:531 start_codon:yes stop_codon:yes gene_type:complete
MRALLLSVLLISCNNDTNLIQKFILDDSLPIEKIKYAKLLYTENGKKKVEVFANIIDRFIDQDINLILEDSISFVFYNDSIIIESILTADKASINESENIMKAIGNVILEGANNRRIETEELIWDQKIDKIYTDKKIKIITEKEVIFGTGFTSTPDFSKYTILNIHGTFDFQDENN